MIKIRTHTLIYLTSSILGLLGCAGNSPTSSLNKHFKEDKYPMRYLKDISHTIGTQYIQGFAGKVGTSATEKVPIVKNDVYKLIKKTCGFTPKDRVQTRIVENKPPYYYEVWIFKDAKSKRDDKKSALSVVLHELPNGGGVDISLKGQCHATKGMTFTFAN
jgi:hypothetical protein